MPGAGTDSTPWPPSGDARHRQRLGARASVMVAGPLEAAAQARARALHLSLEPLSLQQLLVHAASSPADEKVSA